jgi:hypothetical protein
VEAGLHGVDDAVDLADVPPGEDDDVARALLEHPLQEVGRGVDFLAPARGVVRAQVELGDAQEVRGEVGAEGRVDVHDLRHPRVHLLLDERGVEVAGVERHEAHRVRLRRLRGGAHHDHRENEEAEEAPHLRFAASERT